MLVDVEIASLLIIVLTESGTDDIRLVLVASTSVLVENMTLAEVSIATLSGDVCSVVRIFSDVK